MNPDPSSSIPRYAVSEIDGMLLPKPQPDGSWCRWSDVEARLAQLAQEQAKMTRILEIERRGYDRLAICADHRDKVSGRCIVCDGEHRGRADAEAEIKTLRAQHAAEYSMVEWYIAENRHLEAALGEIRQALQQMTEKYETLLSRVGGECFSDRQDPPRKPPTGNPRRCDELLNNLRGCCAFGGTCGTTRERREFCTPCEAAARLEEADEALRLIVCECECWQADACSESVVGRAEAARAALAGRR